MLLLGKELFEVIENQTLKKTIFIIIALFHSLSYNILPTYFNHKSICHPSSVCSEKTLETAYCHGLTFKGLGIFFSRWCSYSLFCLECFSVDVFSMVTYSDL